MKREHANMESKISQITSELEVWKNKFKSL
jgi:hypothetical protein